MQARQSASKQCPKPRNYKGKRGNSRGGNKASKASKMATSTPNTWGSIRASKSATGKPKPNHTETML